MKDYRVTVKVRNNRILRAIEEAGGTPGQKWCEEQGIGYQSINNLVNMTASPLTADGNLSAPAAMLCEAVGKLPDELWSTEQLRPLERNFSEMEMSHEQVMAMLPHEQQSYALDLSDLENRQAQALIGRALESLTPQEQKVIDLRFYSGLTLSEAGKVLDVTSERVRQLEMKALRKMRQPKRAEGLIDCLDDREAEEVRDRLNVLKAYAESA